MSKLFVPPAGFGIDRRVILQAGAALGVSLLAPFARACEISTANFVIVHPWTRASAPGATSAIVCMTFQEVTESDRLIGAKTPVADGADLGGEGAGTGLSYLIRAGQSSVLSETGVHLRLTGLKFPLQMGREYPLTLVFAKAGSVRASVSVDYPRIG